jgi:hypothetical protein
MAVVIAVRATITEVNHGYTVAIVLEKNGRPLRLAEKTVGGWRRKRFGLGPSPEGFPATTSNCSVHASVSGVTLLQHVRERCG